MEGRRGVDAVASRGHHAQQVLRVLGQPHVGEALIAAAAGLTKSAKCSFSWSRKRYDAPPQALTFVRLRKCQSRPVTDSRLAEERANTPPKMFGRL